MVPVGEPFRNNHLQVVFAQLPYKSSISVDWGKKTLFCLLTLADRTSR